MKKLVYICLALGAIVSCARMGSPDGGWYDDDPPRVVSSTPADQSVNVTTKKISILFNEYIKLEDATNKVIVSPPQLEVPEIKASGKKVLVELQDSLKPNTTYTIDFSDAIVDNNEGNPLGKYTYSFSTGETIDTMEVSGTVLNAENLEPVKGILVGLYAADSTFHDSLFTTSPLIRVARTNGSGQFTIKGVKHGSYHAYALQDMDGNYRFSQKSEMLAFDTATYVTSHRPDIRPDTVWADTVTIEKIRMVPFIHYYPDNVVLRAFLEEGQDKHRLKEERKTPEKFTLFFTAPQDSLPRIEGIGFDAQKALLPEPSLHNDTITYWITDTLVSYPDTVAFTLTYLDTDTLGIDRWQTDTLELVAKATHEKLEKERQKKSEEWVKAREKKMKKNKGALPHEENPYEVIYMNHQIRPGSSLDPNQNLTLVFDEPISKVDQERIHFTIKVDTNYVDAPFILRPVEGQICQYRLYAEWQPGERYRLEADSLTFFSALGHYAQSIKSDFRVRSLDEYGAIFVQLKDIAPDDTTSYLVQLLNRSDKPVAEVVADENGRADFFYLKPGDYYMRLIADRNDNGKWDTGEYQSMTPPEEVFYFPRHIPLKAKFEMEQVWNFRSIDRTQQKPKEITKQKADKEKSIKDRNKQREQDKQKGK